MTKKPYNNRRHIWSIIKPEVDVIRNITQTKVNDNQANVRDLQNLQSNGHSLQSFMPLKLRYYCSFTSIEVGPIVSNFDKYRIKEKAVVKHSGGIQVPQYSYALRFSRRNRHFLLPSYAKYIIIKKQTSNFNAILRKPVSVNSSLTNI